MQAFSLVDDPLVGLLSYMQVWLASFLFDGTAVPTNSVIWPFRVFCYVTPSRWGLASLAYVVFVDTPDYAGTKACNTSSPTVLAPPYCNVASLDSQGLGFFCPDAPPSACYGRTGNQILHSLSANFDTINAHVDWLQSVVIMLLQAIFWKTAFITFFALTLSARSTPVQTMRG